MSLRTKIDIEASVGFDNSLDDTAFERGIAEMVDTLERVKTATYQLDPSEDVQVSLDDVAQGRLLYIESNSEVNVRFGAALDEVPLARLASAASTQAPTLKAYLLATVTFTELHIRNPSATEQAQVKVCVVGDLTT